ncbi:MAG: hypothetical protein LW832_01115 [Parachlamydia sp.]|nr:hypothetical protein [Parachlamydia sp.]
MVNMNPQIPQYKEKAINLASDQLKKVGSFNHEEIVFIEKGHLFFPKTQQSDTKQWMIVRWVKSFIYKPTISTDTAEKIFNFYAAQTKLTTATVYRPASDAFRTSLHADARDALLKVSKYLPKDNKALEIQKKIIDLAKAIESNIRVPIQKKEEKTIEIGNVIHHY